MDGASFYDLVTGKINALYELFCALPIVIEETLEKPVGDNSANDTALADNSTVPQGTRIRG